MIYTIGIRLKYERAFAAGPVVKLGSGVGPDGKPLCRRLCLRDDRRGPPFLASKGLTGTHMVMGVLADWGRRHGPSTRAGLTGTSSATRRW